MQVIWRAFMSQTASGTKGAFTMRRPRKIVFAFRRGQAQMGGKLMRVDQLCELATAHLPDDQYQVSSAFVPRDRFVTQTRRFVDACRGAVVIFHKSAAANAGPATRKAIRTTAAGICVDHLDIVVDPLERGFFDVHIAASRAGEAELTQHLSALSPVAGTQVRHLRHHSDPRLKLRASEQLTEFTPGYFGLPDNTDSHARFPADTLVPDYKPIEIDSFLTALPKSNFHLCTRQPFAKRSHGILATKPFTKGFNAAAVGANVLVNRQVHDAVHYLGEDYPFMLKDSSPEDFAEGLNHARDAYGTTEWQIGLDRMGDMAARVAPAEVARELRQIVDLFG